MRILVVTCLVACQPLHGGPSEVLHQPTPLPAPTPVVTETTYVDDCTVDFQRAPRNVVRKQTTAATLVTTGNSALAAATTARDPGTKNQFAVSAIQTYADALRADPYDAEATLKLALSYDAVLRKGCALAMLHRLESLTSNPLFAGDATRSINNIVANPHWFRGYRTAALAAVDH